MSQRSKLKNDSAMQGQRTTTPQRPGETLAPITSDQHRADEAPGQITQSDTLQLQQAFGNHAVAQLLQTEPTNAC